MRPKHTSRGYSRSYGLSSNKNHLIAPAAKYVEGSDSFENPVLYIVYTHDATILWSMYLARHSHPQTSAYLPTNLLANGDQPPYTCLQYNMSYYGCLD